MSTERNEAVTTLRTATNFRGQFLEATIYEDGSVSLATVKIGEDKDHEVALHWLDGKAAWHFVRTLHAVLDASGDGEED